MIIVFVFLICFLTLIPTLTLTRKDDLFENNNYKITNRHKYKGIMQPPAPKSTPNTTQQHGQTNNFSNSYQSSKYIDLDPLQVQIHPDSYLRPKYIEVENIEEIEVFHEHVPDNPPDYYSYYETPDNYDNYQETGEAEEKPEKDRGTGSDINIFGGNKPDLSEKVTTSTCKPCTTSKYDSMLESIYSKVIKFTTQSPDKDSNKYYNGLEIFFNKSILLPSFTTKKYDNPYHDFHDEFEENKNTLTVTDTPKITSTSHTTSKFIQNATSSPMEEITSEFTKLQDDYNDGHDTYDTYDFYYDTNQPTDDQYDHGNENHDNHKYHKPGNRPNKQGKTPSPQLTDIMLTSITADHSKDHTYHKVDINDQQHANEANKAKNENEDFNSPNEPGDDVLTNTFSIKPRIIPRGKKHKHHDQNDSVSHGHPDSSENDNLGYEKDHTQDYSHSNPITFPTDIVDQNTLLASIYREFMNAAAEVAKNLHGQHRSFQIPMETTEKGDTASLHSTVGPAHQNHHHKNTPPPVVHDMTLSENEGNLPQEINITGNHVFESRVLNSTDNPENEIEPYTNPHDRHLHYPENGPKEGIPANIGDSYLNPPSRNNSSDIIGSPITSNRVHARNFFNNSSMVVKLNFNVVPAGKVIEKEGISTTISEDRSSLQKLSNKNTGDHRGTVIGVTVPSIPFNHQVTNDINQQHESEENQPFAANDQTASTTLSPLELLALSYIRRGSEIPEKIKQCIALKQTDCKIEILQENDTKISQKPTEHSIMYHKTTLIPFRRVSQSNATTNKALPRTTKMTTEGTLMSLATILSEYDEEHSDVFNPYWKEPLQNRFKTPTSITYAYHPTTMKTTIKTKKIKTTSCEYHVESTTARKAQGGEVTTHRTILTDDDFLEDLNSNRDDISTEGSLSYENLYFNPHWFHDMKNIFLNGKTLLPESKEHLENSEMVTSSLDDSASDKDDLNTVISVNPVEPSKRPNFSPSKQKRNSTVRKCGGPRNPVVVEVIEQSNFIPVSDTRFVHFPETRSNDRRHRQKNRRQLKRQKDRRK
ncbi:hypothetical protein WDU94_002213 [Cyamophila willieti]